MDETDDESIAKLRREKLASAFDPLSLIKTAVAAYQSYNAPPEHGLSDLERFKVGSGMSDQIPGVDLSRANVGEIRNQFGHDISEAVMNSMGPTVGAVRLNSGGRLMGTIEEGIASSDAAENIAHQAVEKELVKDPYKALQAIEEAPVPNRRESALPPLENRANQHVDEILEKVSEGGSAELTYGQLRDIESRIEELSGSTNPESQAELNRYIKVLDLSHKHALAKEMAQKKESANISGIVQGEAQGTGESKAQLQELEKPKSEYDLRREKTSVAAKKKQNKILSNLESLAQKELSSTEMPDSSYIPEIGDLEHQLRSMRTRIDRNDPRYKEVIEQIEKAKETRYRRYQLKQALYRGKKFANIEAVLPGEGKSSGPSKARLKILSEEE